ncbi:MAG: hypothetical protein K0U47_09680 [Epsilonproteobacteria bacterium]|nr:hypothetical protein [Campylobacterota bacterium]
MKVFLIILILSIFFTIKSLFFDSYLGGEYRLIDRDDFSPYIMKYEKNSLYDKIVVPTKVVDTKYDNRYIFATRIIVDNYQCVDAKSEQLYIGSKIESALEYWIVDKQQKIVYISEDEEKIMKKLYMFDTDLEFNFSEKYEKEINELSKYKDHKDYTQCKKIEYPKKDLMTKIVL